MLGFIEKVRLTFSTFATINCSTLTRPSFTKVLIQAEHGDELQHWWQH